MTTSMPIRKPELFFVGAFPPPGNAVFGGNVADCQSLMDAGLANKVDLITLDSTQRSVPLPPFYLRVVDAARRFGKFLLVVIGKRPKTILIFCSVGFSFFEKSLMACCARLIGCQVLFSPRGGRLMDDVRCCSFYAKCVKVMMGFPHKILCQGNVWRNFFVDEMGISTEKCIVMKSWTATQLLLDIGAQKKYNSNGSLRILFLGWLDATKGILDLIDAFATLHRRYPFIELDVAGEGKASGIARRKADALGVAENIHFLGWVAGERKLSVLSQADIFCLPSHFEGLPNAMIEAMATGLPVIVTPVGAIPDVIINNHNGFFVPPGNVEALIQRLNTLIVDQAKRARIGRAAYATAAEDFTADRAINHLLEMLNA